MGYRHIENLYRNTQILEFKWVFALEKIHGTSGHITYKNGSDKLIFFSGGESRQNFIKLFDEPSLWTKFAACGALEITVYGEVYGGRCQGMKNTYGPNLKFVCFEVEIDGMFLSVPQADEFVKELGLEFVHYEKCETDIEKLNALRDADSVQAIRNSMGPGHKREGIVLRPPFEVRLNHNERLIAKHKADSFRETQKPRAVGVAPEVLSEAQAVSDEWVTAVRLGHVLDKLPKAKGMEHTRMVVEAMLEDVMREGKGEIVDSPAVRKAISKATAALWKQRVSKI